VVRQNRVLKPHEALRHDLHSTFGDRLANTNDAEGDVAQEPALVRVLDGRVERQLIALPDIV